MSFININEAAWEERTNARGETWRFIDLAGERLGVRVEELQPGETSSVHHFHTLEEEHVLVLEGSATLILGTERHSLKAGDHVWFKAGKEAAHHIENTSSQPFRFLVFGERNPGDVVVYPEQQVMMIKALGWKQFTYRPREQSSDSGAGGGG
ncbi:MAG: cupin domain-containing protein [Gammaproteobacteria bacterium]|jgi:uncharacterized cupin superfamily protein